MLLKVGQQRSFQWKKNCAVLYDWSFNGDTLRYLTYELDTADNVTVVADLI
jgi:hypothetical protein